MEIWSFIGFKGDKKDDVEDVCKCWSEMEREEKGVGKRERKRAESVSVDSSLCDTRPLKKTKTNFLLMAKL